MGQKSKKKAGTGSASKLKKLDELAPVVALPAVNDGEAITSAAANSTGEAMTGENGVPVTVTGTGKLSKQGTVANSSGKSKEMENSKTVLVLDAAVTEALKVPAMATVTGTDGRNVQVAAASELSGKQVLGTEISEFLVDEQGGVTTTAIMAGPSSSIETPVTVKPISTNRKVLIEAQKLKTAAKSVSFAENVQNSDGTGHSIAISNSETSGQSGMGNGDAKNSGTTNVEAEKAGNSSMKEQPAEKLVSCTDKAQNWTGVSHSIANSNAENAGNAANSNSRAVNAGNLSTNAQNLCINGKVISVTPLVESVAVPLSTSVDGEPKTGIETVTTIVDSEASIVESLNSVNDSVVIGPGVGMTGGVEQPLVNVIEVSNATQNLENVAGTTGNVIGPVDKDIEPAVMSKNSVNTAGNSGTSVGGSAQLSAWMRERQLRGVLL